MCADVDRRGACGGCGFHCRGWGMRCHGRCGFLWEWQGRCDVRPLAERGGSVSGGSVECGRPHERKDGE